MKVLFELFYRLATEGGSDGRNNTRYLRELNLVSRLLQILQENGSTTLAGSAKESLWNLLGLLLHNNPRPIDVLLYVTFSLNTYYLLPV